MMQRISIFFILLFSIFSIALSGQTIWYVTPTGSGSQNGSSWANAKSLQKAFNDFSSGSYEIRLLTGNYPVSSTLKLNYGYTVTMIGGYNGVGDIRDSVLHPTTLDGLNSTQIMEVINNGNTIVGIIFRNGYVTGDNGGGALYVQADTFNLWGCSFFNNVSDGTRGGGAVFIYGFGKAIEIRTCHFEQNRSNYINYQYGQNGGGAIHNWSDNVQIDNTVFRNNYTENEGAAIYTWGKNLKISNCRFEMNTSKKDGGAIYNNNFDIKINRSHFVRNKSSQDGGAIFNSDKVDIVYSIFQANQSIGNGGALYNSAPSSNKMSQIDRTEFSSNTATQGGGIYTNSDDGLKISSSLFQSNKASDAGGAIFNNEYLEATNCTFVHNTNTAIIIPSYAQTSYRNNITNIYNSIFSDNIAKSGGYKEDINPEVLNVDQSTKDIKRNFLQAYNQGNENQVGVNPGFISSSSNYRLTFNSPAVNYGDNALYNQVSATPAGTSIDLGDMPRLVGSSIDLGAYELQPVAIACPAMTVPTPNATNVPVTTNISWNVITNATGYRLSIGTTSGGNNLLNNVDVGNITTYDHPTDLLSGTKYYVKISPYNQLSSNIHCTEYTFTTTGTSSTVPSCTTIISPADNTTNVSLTPTITWNSAPNATGYRITIGTTPTNSDILNNQDVGNVTSYTLTTVLAQNTLYYIRITPYNTVGNASGCTQTSFRTLTTATVPSCTTIISPANNATNISLTPTITWNSVSNATGYRITIGTTPTNSDILNNQDVGNVTSYTLTTALAQNIQYYVRIIPYNSVGNASGCTQTSFRTLTTPTAPSCTTIISPANNTTNTSVKPTITWTASSGATGYRIRIGTTAGGNDVLSQDLGNVMSFTLSFNLDYSTNYFVQIIPFNSAGDATGCAEHRFTTEKETIEEHKIPNVFTPNNDGINDVADFSFLLNKKNATLQIVDRYGTLHFEGNQNNKFIWNGTHNGLKSKTGTYWYIIIWTNSEEKIVTLKDWILLKSN